MGFPENTFTNFLYWFINTPGIAGMAVSLLGAGIFITVGSVLRWISNGGKADELEEYTFPTTSLLDH